MASITSTAAPVKRYATIESRIENAVNRAQHELGHYARRITATHYVVYSQQNDGTEYHVHLTASGLRCSCKAAQFGKPCKHAARVGLRLQREGYSGIY